MLKIGLTGGIGSGKTTVATYFSEVGIEVIDADVIALALTKPNQPAFHAIVKKFGPTICTDSGTLNRKLLRQRIFTSPLDKKWLETLLHPLIKQRIQEQVQQSHSPYLLIVIPLLIETNAFDLVDRILVVDTCPFLQVARTTARDQIEEKVVTAIMNHQATREQRLAVAHDVILNTGDLSELKNQVIALHQFYLQLIKKS